MSVYKLRQILEGHSKDVRALIHDGDSRLVSGSRDQTIKVWVPGQSESVTVTKLPKYVSCLAIDSENRILTGCNDGIIRIFDRNAVEGDEPVSIWTGHGQTVSSIFVGKFSTVISGSWDTTARVWTGDKCVMTLAGHTAAVWAVGIMPEVGIMITGSADKSIKLWKAGSCVNTIENEHSDCVRALAVLNRVEFLSASNDATIKRWNVDGHCLATYFGHENYIYSISMGNENFDFASSGEDRTVRLWKNNEVQQVIRLPAQSVWSVVVLPNGDVAAGSSDGKIWIFTASPERQASPEIQKIYEEELAKQKLESKTELGGIKLSELPGPESLFESGTRDGQTRMVRDGDKVSVHSWSHADGKWTKIGDVVGASNEGKKLYEGKEYDYVFDIDVDDPPRIIKLPYNVDQEPWVVAQEFINKHQVPQVYLEEIANFIYKNTGGEPLGRGIGSADPLTGGSAYTTSNTNQTSNTPRSGFSGDPFTGGSAYHSSESSSSSQSATPFRGVCDPLTGANAYTSNGGETEMHVDNVYFPQREFLQFGSPPKVDAMMIKLKEFNETMDQDVKLTETDFNHLSEFLLDTLNSAALDITLLIKLMRWPLEKIFPALDILRLAVLNTKVNEILLDPTVIDKLLSVLLTNLEEGAPASNRMLSLRTLSNLFQDPSRGRIAVLHNREPIVNRVNAVLPAENKNVEVALSTLMLNYAVALTGVEVERPVDTKLEGQIQVLSSLSLLFLDGITDPEAKFRTLVAFGTLVASSKENVEYALTMDAKSRIMNWKLMGEKDKITKCASCILSLM